MGGHLNIMNLLKLNRETTMSSREIAELTGKDHDNVLRDIRKMREDAIGLKSEANETTYKDSIGRTLPAFDLTYHATMVLVTGYSVKLRAAVLKRWQELEHQQTQTVATNRPTTQLEEAAYSATALHVFFTQIGLNKNCAAIAANQAVVKTTGVDLLQLGGQTHLTKSVQRRVITPTDIGLALTPQISAIKVNKLLALHGYQAETRDLKGALVWMPTPKADGLYEWQDTGKRHKDGTPAQQLKWSESIIGDLAK